MEVITTHLNADFDAFASMVAAKKLYPDAVVSFPGSQEKSLREFFMESTLYILSIERAKDIDLEQVHRLILVDTRQKSRIGRFAALVDSGKAEIHIYDHHPNSEDDIKGHMELVREVGSTATVLIRLIRERGYELNSEEATILALGIYEDTGSFSFPSTTPEDLEAAGWLLDQGANLNVISNMMTSDLNKDQVEVLHQLIEESETLNFGGVDVLITTAGVEGYVGDLAILVHKYKDMENLAAIFALVRMEDRIHLIARSSIEEVNAQEVAAEFGGGGHPTAASATVRNMALYEARAKLVSILRERVRPKRVAREIMSRPVISISRNRTMAEALEYLTRYQVSSLPVLENGTVLGILHRNAVEKAHHHGLDMQPVTDYMNPGVVFVTPDEPIEKVLNIAVEGRHRLVPVIDRGQMVGVISRGDLLEHLKLPRQADSAVPEEFPSGRSRHKSVRRLMEERLPPRVLQTLKRAGAVAADRGEEVFLVGGAVRDLLLRNHNLDIDLVIEGQGIPFARQLAEEFSDCRVRGHEKFGTAVMLFPDGFKIDVATARHEYYARPGALPTVETSSLKRDLFRRDFAMNTLAVSLNPKTFGQVTDFFGGARDIKEKVIRVLHNLAFVEDPTRILRAVRFSSRFGFAIGKHALNLMKGAIKMKIFDRVEGKRLLNELIHILEEKNPLVALHQTASLGILPALHPSLSFNAKVAELFESVAAVLSWWKYLFDKSRLVPWVIYFLALTDVLSDDDFEGVMRRFSFPSSQIDQMLRERTEMRYILAYFAREMFDRPSKVVAALRGLPLEALLFMMAKTAREDTRRAISGYITTMRHVKPALTGKDLVEMGYKPGPTVGLLLRTLRDARVDGLAASVEDERRIIREFFPIDDANSSPGSGAELPGT
jgi:tRNA nucleotidyltransferase (CCA-adding enzyme)